MAATQLVQLASTFEKVGELKQVDADNLGQWLNAGGLTQLSDELSAELEKKGAPPTRAPGALKRYIVVAVTQRLQAGDPITGLLDGYAAEQKFPPFRSDFPFQDDHRIAFAYFLAGMGYTQNRVAGFTTEEMQGLRDLSGLSSEEGIPEFDDYLVRGMLQSVVEHPLEAKMKDELKLRLEFKEHMTIHWQEIKQHFETLEPEFETLVPDFSGSIAGNIWSILLKNFIAGMGFDLNDCLRFTAVDIAAFLELIGREYVESNLSHFTKGLLQN